MDDLKSTPEPVVTVEAVRLVLLGLVAVGWVSLDETALMTVASAVAVLVSVGGSLWARARVTPLGKRWLG